MTTALDANILIELASTGSDRVADSVIQYASQGPLVICPVVYAETSAPFKSRDSIDAFLAEFEVSISPIERDAAFAAGKIFREYLKKGGSKTRILADFLIGGHAMLQASQLLTMDRGFYRQYFRGLKIVEP